MYENNSFSFDIFGFSISLGFIILVVNGVIWSVSMDGYVDILVMQFIYYVQSGWSMVPDPYS